ncbi:MAG TPA: hypothetical protein PLE09_04700 [Caldisericia bacterium]|nr:hypothetical protein [Caldisericia bacterium]
MVQHCIFWNSVFILFLIVFYLFFFIVSLWKCYFLNRILVLSGLLSDILFIPWLFLFPAVVYDFTEDSVVWMYILLGLILIFILYKRASSQKITYFFGVNDANDLVAALERSFEKQNIKFQLDEVSRTFYLPETSISLSIEKNTFFVSSVMLKSSQTITTTLYKRYIQPAMFELQKFVTPNGRTLLMFCIAFLLLISALVLTSHKVYHFGLFLWG